MNTGKSWYCNGGGCKSRVHNSAMLPEGWEQNGRSHYCDECAPYANTRHWDEADRAAKRR